MMAFLSLLARNRLAIVGLFVLSFVILLSLLTPFLNLSDPDITNTAERFNMPFSSNAILGTDHLGRDLFSRLLWGTRLSLAVGFLAAVIAAVCGAAIGILATVVGNTDNILMRGDMLMAFPYILLAWQSLQLRTWIHECFNCRCSRQHPFFCAQYSWGNGRDRAP